MVIDYLVATANFLFNFNLFFAINTLAVDRFSELF